MEFEIKDEIVIYLGRKKNGQEYWMFSLYKKESGGNSFFREFYFDKTDFSFLENIKKGDIYSATKDEFELLLTCKEGPIILEQMKSLVREVEKLKKEDNFYFTTLNEQKWNERSFIMELIVNDSPIILHCYCETLSGKLSTSLYLKEAKPKCYLMLMEQNKNNYEIAALDFIKKKSKQRLRMLTNGN